MASKIDNSNSDYKSEVCSAVSLDLDSILKQLGQFGKYQLINYLLICIPITLSAVYTMSYIFTAGQLDYRCHIPECESLGSEYYNPEWLQHVVPFKDGKPKRCDRFTPVINTINYGSDEVCPAIWFSNETQKCDKFVFETEERTIVSEFNVTCEDNEWKLALAGTINNIGQFASLPFAGLISDRFGRRTVFVFSVVMSGVVGIVRSFSTGYTMFILLEFLDPMLGAAVYSAGFILGMELVGPNKRVLGGAIISCFYAIGECLLGIAAMYTLNWRTILRIFYAPGILVFVYIWLIPESVRWLMLNGHKEKAAAIIQKAAKTNGVVLSESAIQSLYSEKTAIDEEANNGNVLIQKEKTAKFPLQTIARSPSLVLRVVICSFVWFTNAFVYYGLSLNSVSVAGSKYLNFILVSLIEVPGYITTYFISERVGRKTALVGALVFSGMSCIVSQFVPAGVEWLALLLFLLGKFSITVSFTVLYVYTTELFPTSMRHSLLATCSMFGRIGSMIAPQTPLLARYAASLPLYLFGGTALTAGVLILKFPETLNTKLPDTVEEAENIGLIKIKEIEKNENSVI